MSAAPAPGCDRVKQLYGYYCLTRATVCANPGRVTEAVAPSDIPSLQQYALPFAHACLPDCLQPLMGCITVK